MGESSTLIVAHRGASAVAPENTLASVTLAWEMKSDAVEVDLRLTKDKKVVAIHDNTTGRTTGLDRAIGTLKFDDLQKLDAGSWKGKRWRGEKIPALRDLLKSVPERRRMVLELKEGIDLLNALKDELKATPMRPGQVELIAFDYDLAREAKRQLPDTKVLWLFGDYKSVQENRWIELKAELIHKALDAKLDGLDLGIKKMDFAFYEEIRSAGLELYLWTVNDLEVGRRLLQTGLINAVTTDVPDAFVELRRTLT